MTTPDENFTALETEVAEVVGILLETFSAEDADENPIDNIDNVVEGIGRYAQQVERVGSTAGHVGFFGLQDVCLLFQENLSNLVSQRRKLTESEREKLEEWPTLIIGYIASPDDTQAVDDLIQHLQSGVWEKPLLEDEADVLSSLLLSPLTCNEVVADANDAAAQENEISANEAADEVMPPSCTASFQENQEDCEETEDEISQTLTSLQQAQQEVLEVLCLEITQIAEAAEDILNLVISDISAASRQEALLNYAELVARFADASAAVGLQGLYQVCCQVQVNLNQLVQQNEVISLEQQQVVKRWPNQVLPYLQELTDSQISDNLVRYLQNAQWPSPLPAAQADTLRELLVAPTLTVDAAEVEMRQRQATSEDVSLAVPDDVNPELLDSLLQELPAQAGEFSAAIQRLSQGEGTLQDVDVAQRIAHTLKGAGNTVGVRGIATLTHHVEDILLALAKHKALPTQVLTETLLNAADCLETMSETLVGISAPPSQAQAVLQQVLDWANRIDREGLPASNDRENPIQHDVATTVPANLPAEEATPSSTTTASLLRIPATLVDDLLRLVGESVILTGQIHEQVHKTIRHTQSVQRQNLLFQQLTAELEQLIEIQNLSSPLSRPLSANGFDPLELEQYNELNTVTHRLLEVATDARELSQHVRNDLATLDTLLVSQRRLQRENQEAVLRTRMVPVKTVVSRLQRSVRQTCRLTDKEAELQVSGVETLMDSNVLNDLVDPLMHLLRNAVDHGIERSALRKELGKDSKGRIMLAFAREGNRIVVRCQDDGAGLDWEAIRRTAEQRGLLSSEKPLEEEELSRLILLPGFSTRTDTTQTSGRGIGMDAVYSRVQEIKGSLSIQSRPGEGCLIELRLPLTLISTHALLVRMGEQRFAISDRGIKQILYPGSGQIHKLGGILTYQTEDEIYELNMLAALLQLSADATSQADHVCPLLLVQDESGATRAVLVEEVLDSRDMVVKSLGQYLPKLAGIVGATILGDGSVIPVLDLPELLRTAVPGYGLPAAVERKEVVQERSARHQHSALVVDDSLSARRSLAQFIADAGFTVRTAKDGLEAIEMIDSERPDLLLVDMEMPRMNGLELTSHVRANAATRHLPVIMITSRSTDKHRREAKVAGVTIYLTKPFAEDELLEHIGQILERA